MKWTKFTLKTTTEAVDLISSMLDELGIEGIEIEDNVPLSEADTKGMFIDILPELPPDDGTAKVSFYLEDLSNLEDLLRNIEEGLDDLSEFVNVGERTIAVSETEDKDWINNWKQYFKPFTVDDILIKPTWEEIPAEHADKLLIEIDPGTAFGTGKHETTQLCIRQLDKYIKGGEKVLDVGTGSGILGIAALKLGASEAFGTDLDENAVVAVRENLEANHIPARSSALFREISSMTRQFRIRQDTSATTSLWQTFLLRSSSCFRVRSHLTSSTAESSSHPESLTRRKKMCVRQWRQIRNWRSWRSTIRTTGFPSPHAESRKRACIIFL